MTGLGDLTVADDYYVLDGHDFRRPVDYAEWIAMWKQRDARRVASTEVGASTVSTVFLGVDHGWGGGRPLLFETMVFGGVDGEPQWRWHTWDEAQSGHERIVEALRTGRGLDDIADDKTETDPS